MTHERHGHGDGGDEAPLPSEGHERLQRLTAVLSRAMTVRDATEAMVTAGREALGADAAAVWLLDSHQAPLQLASQVGLLPEVVRRWRSAPVEASPPVIGAVPDGGDVLVVDARRDVRSASPMMRDIAVAFDLSTAAPMLVDHGEAVGLVLFAFRAARGFDRAERAFVRAVASLGALAIHRGRLYERLQRAYEQEHFLGEAGQLLAGSLDIAEVLARVARLAVPMVADACAVFMREEEGMRTAAAAHADTHRQETLDRLVSHRPVIHNRYIEETLRTGQPLVFPVLPPDFVEDVAEDGEHLTLLQAFGMTSLLAVPLRARGRIIGGLALAMTHGARALGEEDLSFARQLAAKAALAIDNARLHSERSTLASQLQEALHSRVVIEQAKGILAERHGVPMEGAFQLLRQAARRRNRKLHDMAADVVGGKEDPAV